MESNPERLKVEATVLSLVSTMLEIGPRTRERGEKCVANEIAAFP